MKIKLIMALDEENGLGKNGTLAWHHKEDLKYFKEYTKNNICIMGSKTFLDIVSFKKKINEPVLENRHCIVLTSKPSKYKTMYNFSNVSFINDIQHSLADILYFVSKDSISSIKNYEEVSIIGGKSIYEYFLKNATAEEISITRVFGKHDCDVFMDDINTYLIDYIPHDTKRLSDHCVVEIYKRVDNYENE